ncbi:MAG: hypothetical protein HWN67_06050 [Candidatus Helarchaeota archaeon]|nr:hypothetical protein [Candidatus Helarchaeota archaeon]
MKKINALYIGAAIGVILFVFLLIVPPTIRMMEQLHFDIQSRWIILTTIIPIISIILLYSVLSYIRALHSEREKEQVKEIIKADLTEDEIFEDALFENEKMRVLSVIHSFAKIKGKKIPLSAIEKKTNFDIDKIEDIIVLLMADELLDGHFDYPDDGPIFVLPEKKEIKVRYIKDSKENIEKKDEKKKFGEEGSDLD